MLRAGMRPRQWTAPPSCREIRTRNSAQGAADGPPADRTPGAAEGMAVVDGPPNARR